MKAVAEPAQPFVLSGTGATGGIVIRHGRVVQRRAPCGQAYRTPGRGTRWCRDRGRDRHTSARRQSCSPSASARPIEPRLRHSPPCAPRVCAAGCGGAPWPPAIARLNPLSPPAFAKSGNSASMRRSSCNTICSISGDFPPVSYPSSAVALERTHTKSSASVCPSRSRSMTFAEQVEHGRLREWRGFVERGENARMVRIVAQNAQRRRFRQGSGRKPLGIVQSSRANFCCCTPPAIRALRLGSQTGRPHPSRRCGPPEYLRTGRHAAPNLKSQTPAYRGARLPERQAWSPAALLHSPEWISWRRGRTRNRRQCHAGWATLRWPKWQR